MAANVVIDSCFPFCEPLIQKCYLVIIMNSNTQLCVASRLKLL